MKKFRLSSVMISCVKSIYKLSFVVIIIREKQKKKTSRTTIKKAKIVLNKNNVQWKDFRQWAKKKWRDEHWSFWVLKIQNSRAIERSFMNKIRKKIRWFFLEDEVKWFLLKSMKVIDKKLIWLILNVMWQKIFEMTKHDNSFVDRKIIIWHRKVVQINWSNFATQSFTKFFSRSFYYWIFVRCKSNKMSV